MTSPPPRPTDTSHQASRTGRKFIEVELPLDTINQAGRAEKAVPRKGLPATMHIWWSRKPTGVARAILFASLVDHPADRPDLWPKTSEQKQRRNELIDLIGDLAHWNCPQSRLAEAHEILSEQFEGNLPEVIDPFCGGGAIPFAATTLRLPTRGSDLNPIAAMTTRAITEVPTRVAGLGPIHPSHEPMDPAASPMMGIATDIAAYGKDLIDEVKRRIGHAYPEPSAIDGSPTQAVSYLWARTATCANASCKAEIPLLSTWWLSKKKTNPWHVRPTPSEDQNGVTRLGFQVTRGPKPDDLSDLKVGTGANFRCPTCGETTDAEAIRSQGRSSHLGLRLIAIQTFANPAKPRGGRAWTHASNELEAAALGAWPKGRPFPIVGHELPTSSGNIGSFGVETLEDILTPRQRLLMTTACEVLGEMRTGIHVNAIAAGQPDDQTPLRLGGRGATAYTDAVTTYLAITISRMANRVSTMTVHNRANGSVEQSFIQPGYAFYGDFPEADPFSGSTGSWGNALDHVVAAVAALPVGPAAEITCGSAIGELASMAKSAGQQPHQGETTKKISHSARPEPSSPKSRSPMFTTTPLSTSTEASNPVFTVSTDPPYYDMFDYAALSELFYPWLRLTLGDIWPDDTTKQHVPHSDQIVPNPGRFEGDLEVAHAHFEVGLTNTLSAIRDLQCPDAPFTIYYGYQRTQSHADGRSSTAWEALLSALVRTGITVVKTWPLRTERPEGVKSNSNALASSVLLVCRQRPEAAPTTSLDEFTALLRQRLTESLNRLHTSNITPADLGQTLVGDALAVFTTFIDVTDIDGSSISVRTVLQTTYRLIDEAFEAEASRFDPQTRWAIEWYRRHGEEAAPITEALKLAKLTDTAIPNLAAGGLIEIDDSRVHLLLAPNATNDTDRANPRPKPSDHSCVWLTTQAVVTDLESKGAEAAAQLISHIRRKWSRGETDAIRDLAYHLYWVDTSCGRPSAARKWNHLVQSWSHFTSRYGLGSPDGATTPSASCRSYQDG